MRRSAFPVGSKCSAGAPEAGKPQSCPADSLGTSVLWAATDRRERMGHLDSIDLPNRQERDSSAAEAAKSRGWAWIVALALVAVAIWYYRGTRPMSEAGGKA